MPGVLQSACLGVHADREAAWVEPGGLEHRRTVARAEVQQRARMRGDQVIDLADVNLGQLPSGDHAHGRAS
jgi:hypothetical protein